MSAPILSEPFVIVPAIWHREGFAYDSVLESGLDALTNSENEKRIVGYTPVLASQSLDSPLEAAIRTGINPDTADESVVVELDDPLGRNLSPVLAQGMYVGDRITVRGVNNPTIIASRLFDVKPVVTHGSGRG